MLKLRNHIATVLFTGMLVGCSTSFTYNRLDWLVPWYVADYVSLDADQKTILRARVDSLLDWHRNEELAGYIEILSRIERDTHSEVTAAGVRDWINSAWEAVVRIEATALPSAIEVGKNLSNDQMEEFISSLWQRQQELEEEYLERDDDEYRVDVYKRLESNLSRFTGRLNGGQELRLQRAADEIRRYDSIWLQGREAWLLRLEPLLRQRATGWQQSVLSVHETRRDYRSAVYYSTREYNLNIISAAIADVINDLDKRQQQRLTREITDLRNELRSLIGASDEV